METRVTLRKKPISGNRESIYLDFYPPITDPKTGSLTRREFLNSFLISDIEHEEQYYKDRNGKMQRRIVPVLNKSGKPKIRKISAWDKLHNKETWERAEQIKLRRENEINKPNIYSEFEKERLKFSEAGKESVLEYFKSFVEKRKKGSDKANFNTVYKYLDDFTRGKLNFNDLDETICENFKNHLLSHKAYDSENSVSPNTAAKYFLNFKAVLKQAYKDKKIAFNFATNITNIKTVDSERNFLTLDEINKLAKTDCFDIFMKKAALFSCMTGLRKSDILNLTWRDVEIIEKKPVIRFRQQKTKGVETLWISDQAYSLLGAPGEPDEKVFPGLKIDSYHTKYLELWLQKAGITKKISFHCMRHSFATLQMAAGTDIYTVSKLLGHKNVRTTQIYAKVIDKLKQDAAGRIKLDL